MQSVALAGLLAEPERLRSYAAIVLGATLPEDIATRAGLATTTVHSAVRRLQAGGLVTAGRGHRASTVGTRPTRRGGDVPGRPGGV